MALVWVYSGTYRPCNISFSASYAVTSRSKSDVMYLNGPLWWNPLANYVRPYTLFIGREEDNTEHVIQNEKLRAYTEE
jgi:hypothetical protein